MFLKKEELPILDSSVVLYELSALQRLEYFEYLADLEASPPKDLTGIKLQTWQMKLNLNVNVWLVAHSISNSKPESKVDDLKREVSQTWSSEAINQAVEKILILSDMVPKNPEPKDAEQEEEGSPDTDKPLAK
ncbi:phage tail assembly chaperone G [Klebsiella sp. BIGb0407]|uniref:phage tail assembly chaperone G n=1 Tax=Klebsiella sp. BIGb0407 TaxID=2940603 RepID=UPI002168A8CB|nr:phage minor tail protein G [Klebsiella sp. BIGb0407]MCS3433703.1 phage minor tail protein G [Klebsiella sp. BIGb0407]